MKNTFKALAVSLFSIGTDHIVRKAVEEFLDQSYEKSKTLCLYASFLFSISILFVFSLCLLMLLLFKGAASPEQFIAAYTSLPVILLVSLSLVLVLAFFIVYRSFSVLKNDVKKEAADTPPSSPEKKHLPVGASGATDAVVGEDTLLPLFEIATAALTFYLAFKKPHNQN